MPKPKKKPRKPGPPPKPDAERSRSVNSSVSPQAYARLLRIFGNASAGGRICLVALREDEMVELKNRGK
jgi:hypothetical protein